MGPDPYLRCQYRCHSFMVLTRSGNRAAGFGRAAGVTMLIPVGWLTSSSGEERPTGQVRGGAKTWDRTGMHRELTHKAGRREQCNGGRRADRKGDTKKGG